MRRLGCVLAVVALLVLASAGCSGSSNSSKQPQTPAQAPPVDWRGQKAVSVDVTDNMFTPPNIVVSPGTKVTWTNHGSSVHNIQKAADAIDFGAPFGVGISDFGPGKSYSFTFTKIGNLYAYTCTIHTGMTGHVDVEAGPATSTSTSAP